MVEELAARRLSGPALAVFCIITLLAIAITLNQLLNLQLFVGVVFIESRYLYLLAALLLPLVFLVYGANARAAETRVPWYDWVLAAASVATLGWYAWQAERAVSAGWEYSAPFAAVIVAAAVCVLISEGMRRTSGTVMMVICVVVGLYPLIADKLPSPLSGHAKTLAETIAYHIASSKSAFGIPMRAFGEIVVGYIVFGVALNYTGGGKFFNDLAFALVGHMRGGAAQVGVISSALQGSISGSVISNVITSGVVTIPAMKRTGLSRRLRGRRRGGRFDRRGADAAGDGIDGVRHGVVPRHALQRDRARGGRARPSVLFRADGADRRLCGAARPVGHETRGTAAVAAL